MGSKNQRAISLGINPNPDGVPDFLALATDVGVIGTADLDPGAIKAIENVIRPVMIPEQERVVVSLGRISIGVTMVMKSQRGVDYL